MRVITIEKLKKWMDENKVLCNLKYPDGKEEVEQVYLYPALFEFMVANMQDIQIDYELNN